MRRAYIALVVGQVADGVTFVIAMSMLPLSIVVGHVERNPLIALIFMAFGSVGVLLTKVGIGSLVAALGLRLPPSQTPRRRLINAAVVVAAASGFVGAGFNTYAIGQLLGVVS